MAKMNSKIRYMYDAAPSVALLPKAVAETATFTGAGLVLDVLEGYWNKSPVVQADKTLAVVIHVTDIAASARTATMTFASVVATDTFTLSDGVDSITLEADADYAVGADDTETAAAAADAINDAYDAGEIAISATSALGVITLTNHLGTGGSITEAETTITSTAFAGNNETYTLDIEAGPAGFASSVVLSSYAVSAPGQYIVLLDVDTIKAIKSDAAALRVKGTLAGASPSVTVHAWLTAVQK